METIEWVLLFTWISLILNIVTTSAVIGLVYRRANVQPKKNTKR